MHNYCVYELIFPNGKRYIGLTGQKPESRWKNGRGYKGQLVYKPIKKYGWKNIKHIVISSGLTQEQAVRLEKYLIGYYKSYLRLITSVLSALRERFNLRAQVLQMP